MQQVAHVTTQPSNAAAITSAKKNNMYRSTGVGWASVNLTNWRKAFIARQRWRYISGTINCKVKAKPKAKQARKNAKTQNAISNGVPGREPPPRKINGSASPSVPRTANVIRVSRPRTEKIKKLFPSGRNSFHGAT